jgi:ribosomal protein S18 acetylase RimI-like enzyme
MTEVSFRPATVDDMAGVTRLRIAGWRAAYSHVMQQSFLDRMEALADREIASRRARFGEDGVLQWVGSQTGSIVGWALSGPGKDEDAPTERELYALYTDAATHGSGLAAALLAAVIGDGPASLWVLEDNPRARAFYSRQGFVADGTRKMLDGELSHIPEIRMVRHP